MIILRALWRWGSECRDLISKLWTYGFVHVKVPEHPLGLAVEKHLRSYGVDTSLLLKGGPRLGTYYMETGIGERAASVIYDRAGSSFAVMDRLEWSLEDCFKGVDLFHVSGITPALSENWRWLTKELMEATKQSELSNQF